MGVYDGKYNIWFGYCVVEALPKIRRSNANWEIYLIEDLTRVGFLGQIVKFVGAGEVWMRGGDACVALAGGGRLTRPGRGRRKRPLPAQPNSRPYGYEGTSEAMSPHTYPCKARVTGMGMYWPL